MIVRILVTAILFLFAIYAFWGGALGQGYLINPFGILFLGITVVVWFAWRPISEGFISAKNESDIPIIRLGYAIINGMMHRPNPPRRGGTGQP